MFGNGGLSASDSCLFGRSHGHAIAHNFFLSVVKANFSLVNTPKLTKGSPLSFRPTGEIFLRSLAFARDDGPRPSLSKVEKGRQARKELRKLRSVYRKTATLYIGLWSNKRTYHYSYIVNPQTNPHWDYPDFVFDFP